MNFEIHDPNLRKTINHRKKCKQLCKFQNIFPTIGHAAKTPSVWQAGKLKFFLKNMRKKHSTKIVCTWSLCQGSGARAWSIYTYQYSAFYLKKLNIRKWSFLLLQQGGYNELHVMAMMSTKRSAKLVKFMAPWVRNSGLWVGTL